jgi:hypothetical protein
MRCVFSVQISLPSCPAISHTHLKEGRVGPRTSLDDFVEGNSLVPAARHRTSLLVFQLPIEALTTYLLRWLNVNKIILILLSITLWNLSIVKYVDARGWVCVFRSTGIFIV